MQNKTVVLAAGDFPKKGSPAFTALQDATRVVCCDSAADSFRRKMKRAPFAVVGDGDSLRGKFTRVVQIKEQESNDLEKAVNWCEENGFNCPLILGATGKRDDHTLGNLFRALALGCDVLTDFGLFKVLEGKAQFNVKQGQNVSIFAPNALTKMTSRGLEWPLNKVTFSNLYCATLNRARDTKIFLTSTHRVFVYFPFD